MVLGVAQDGGRPQAGCEKACCAAAWSDPGLRRLAACLGLVDGAGGRWLVDATPDFKEQIHRLGAAGPPAGILLTHGHTGHYTGLLHLGREAMGARGVPVHAMPRMERLLREHEPWRSLVGEGAIRIERLAAGRTVDLGPDLVATPIPVPHRDELTETVAFRVRGPRRSLLWCPDTDGWEAWSPPLEELLARVDRAYLDGTFGDDSELPERARAEIRHPTIAHTLERLGGLPAAERAKVRFIHLNHTNPALDPESDQAREIERRGAGVAREGQRLEL